jgi:O-antigen/teichoic acid export membrane protein
MDLFKQKTISGIGWSIVSRVGRQLVQFVIAVILARLLSPEEFGLIGMITVFIGFANIFLDMGFGSALIQKQDAGIVHFDSVFWINVIAGLLITITFLLTSSLIADFFNQPILSPLTKFIALSFLVGSLGIVHTSRLKKSLNFKRLALIEISALALSGIIAVITALAGLGVWSLALQSVLLSIFTVSLLWINSEWKPRIKFEFSYVKELLGFSSNLLGFSSFNYWIRNVDNLLIGKVIGSSALGIYGTAYRILLLPLSLISHTIGQVLFPAFSTIQTDKNRISRAYLNITSVIALITFPMMMGLFVVSDHFVKAVFGNQWLDMIPILRIFSIVSMVQSISTVNGNLYLSQGRTDLQFRVGLIIGSLGIGAIVIGLTWGIVGVALAYGIISILVFYPSLYIAVSLVGLRALDVLKNLSRIFLFSLIMSMVIWLIDLILPKQWASWISLISLSSLGAVLFFALIHLFNLRAYLDVKNLIIDQFKMLKSSNRSVIL